MSEGFTINITKLMNELRGQNEDLNRIFDFTDAIVRENKIYKARIKELEQKLSQYEWRDIKDAPKDGTEIFALQDGNQFLAFYDRQNHGWWSLSGTLPVDEIQPDRCCRVPPLPQEVNKEALKNLTQIGEEMGLYDLPESPQEGEE